jgi:hypothetical protein
LYSLRPASTRSRIVIAETSANSDASYEVRCKYTYMTCQCCGRSLVAVDRSLGIVTQSGNSPVYALSCMGSGEICAASTLAPSPSGRVAQTTATRPRPHASERSPSLTLAATSDASDGGWIATRDGQPCGGRPDGVSPSKNSLRTRLSNRCTRSWYRQGDGPVERGVGTPTSKVKEPCSCRELRPCWSGGVFVLV